MIPIIAVIVIAVAVAGTVILSALLLFGASQPATSGDRHDFRPSPYQPMGMLTRHAPSLQANGHEEVHA